LLYRILDFVDALAHASTISTRSRTVQKVFVTPAAIAGVHRNSNVGLHEVVIDIMQSDCRFEVFQLVGKRIRQSRRPPGRTKTAICVSVNETILDKALKRWRDKTSRLVEKLLDLYAANRIPLEEVTHER
jgi:hypothetical protein